MSSRKEMRKIHDEASTIIWDADWYNIREIQGIVTMS